MIRRHVKKSVTVDIAGQKFTLKTDADEAYVKSLAHFVTRKMDEAKRNARTVATQSVAILAALHIADDLFQFRHKVKEKSRTILDILEKENA
jgi:cell division protein ZapA